MPWLTWPNVLRKVGEQGSLSGLVVVRTVVSVQDASATTSLVCDLGPMTRSVEETVGSSGRCGHSKESVYDAPPNFCTHTCMVRSTTHGR